MNNLQRAIKIIGGQSAAARAMGVKQQTVYCWLKTGRVPASRVIQLEKATKGLVSRHDLRPDIYPEG